MTEISQQKKTDSKGQLLRYKKGNGTQLTQEDNLMKS